MYGIIEIKKLHRGKSTDVRDRIYIVIFLLLLFLFGGVLSSHLGT